MALFNSQTHQEIWIDHHCGRCWFGQGLGDPTKSQCHVLTKALRHDRKPVEWERNTRKGALMADTMKCHMETRIPPKVGVPRVVTDETMELFNVQTPSATMDSDHA